MEGVKKTVITLAASVKEIALGKRMVARQREEEGKPHYINDLISLLCFCTYILKVMCLVDFPGFAWSGYHMKHPSPAVVSQPCLIFPLCVRQREILFHASFIDSLLRFHKLLHLPVLFQRLKTERDDCTSVEYGHMCHIIRCCWCHRWHLFWICGKKCSSLVLHLGLKSFLESYYVLRCSIFSHADRGDTCIPSTKNRINRNLYFMWRAAAWEIQQIT